MHEEGKNEVALSLGFIYKGKGCPCNGSPERYVIERNSRQYKLTYWPKRDAYRLESSGMAIAFGNSQTIMDKIKSIWD